MGNLMDAILAIMGLVSGFYVLALMLGHHGPVAAQQETESPIQSHAIHPPADRLAA